VGWKDGGWRRRSGQRGLEGKETGDREERGRRQKNIIIKRKGVEREKKKDLGKQRKEIDWRTRRDR
jgi:hypothetical protein